MCFIEIPLAGGLSGSAAPRERLKAGWGFESSAACPAKRTLYQKDQANTSSDAFGSFCLSESELLRKTGRLCTRHRPGDHRNKAAMISVSRSWIPIARVEPRIK